MGYTRKDRIIAGLKRCRERYNNGSSTVCEKCPFHGHQYPCMDELFTKAIEYIDGKLTAHLPETGYDYQHDEDAFYCGECGRRVFRSYRCCPGCGEQIDWCEVEDE